MLDGAAGRVDRRDLDEEFLGVEIAQQNSDIHRHALSKGKVEGDLAVAGAEKAFGVGRHPGEIPFAHRDEAVAQDSVGGVDRELELHPPARVEVVFDLDQAIEECIATERSDGGEGGHQSGGVVALR